MENSVTKIQLNLQNDQPIFRIGVFESQEYVDFKVDGKFTVTDGNGNTQIKNVSSDLKWRVKIKESQPGKDSYFLVLYESSDKEAVEAKMEIALKFNPEVSMDTLGGDIFIGDRKVNNNSKYILRVGSFPSEMAARKAFKRFQPDFIPRVEKEMVKAPNGQLEIFDAEYDQSAEVNNVVRIIPASPETRIKVYGIRSFNDILQKENFSDLVYDGTMEFRFDTRGLLQGISEVQLEAYLRRVIYSEIGTKLPLEFAKSLAIVCRSEAMARINHRRLGDPYDYSWTGQTLRYFGEDFNDENIDKAVELTRGEVIVADKLVRDTPFHLISGGHTEDDFDRDEDQGKHHLRGKYNWHTVPKGFKSLKDEAAAVKWIHSRPETWCNLKGRDLPPSLERVKKYFRWEVNYSRRELEEIIRKKTGEDIGILFEIIPHVRGVSGRLTEIELIGSLKNYRIRGELNIRQALAHEYLASSCFTVERDLDETGTPISFTLVGAGQGHGVGMCKTGAAVMAMEKNKCKDILKHYFEDCTIASIYKIKLS